MSDFEDFIDDALGPQPFGAGKEPGEQGSVEWLKARVGKVTASRFGDVLDRLKNGKPGARRTAYLWEVVIERLTGQPAQHYASAAMRWGTEQEAYARLAYEAATGAIVAETGFHHHPTLEGVGGSPDGLVGDDGCVEIKCPWNSAHHLACWLDEMPADHTPQVQGIPWILGRQWCDFVSFDPRMPEGLQLYVQRVPFDPDYGARLDAEISQFLAEAADLQERIQKRERADA